MKRIIGYFASRGMVTNWIILIVMAAGIFGFTQLRRRVWPQIDFDYANLEISWPGASAAEIEGVLTIPIEERLKGLEGVDRFTSTTGDGYVNFWLETSPDVPMDRVLDMVKGAVDTVPDYPSEAGRPRVYQEESWNRVMLLFIYGPDDPDILRVISDGFRNRLLATGEVSQIDEWGMPEKEILISYTPSVLQRYGITPREVEEAVRSSDLNISAGAVQNGSENLEIRYYGRQTDANSIAAIPVKLSSGTVPLGTLAEVREQWPEDAVYTWANGRPAVGFDIMYTNDEDVLSISAAVDRIIAEESLEYGDLVVFKPFIRDSEQIEERLGTLSVSGLLGLLLVVVILGIFLNLRLSFWVAFGIPFSFLGLFLIEWMLDITINEMSLFGMIMVLGILVDDGIVIGENIHTHWKEYGKTPLQAAKDGTVEVLAPVAVSIITTMVAFTPYFFIYGEMGQYTSQIGLVIILCLAFSLVEAAVILPVHLAHSGALQGGMKSPDILRRGLDRFQEGLVHKVYGPALKTALAHRGLFLAGTLAVVLLLAGALAGNHVKAMFFPEVEMPYSYAEIDFPAGTSSAVVDQVRSRITRRALELGSQSPWAIPEKGYENALLDVLSWGQGSRIWIYFILIPNEDRSYTAGEFSRILYDGMGPVPEAVSFKLGEETAFGGYPISVRFVGDDQAALEKAAAMLKTGIAGLAGVKDISDDTPLGARELVYSLNDRGVALGFTPASLAVQVRDGWYGNEVARINEGTRRVPVVMRLGSDNRGSLNGLDRFSVTGPRGDRVAVGSVVDYRIERGLNQIRRENGFRAIRINAGFDTGLNDLNVVLSEINNELVPAVLEAVPGVSLSTGGQAEEVNRMMKSMAFAMIGALLIMFTILMTATGSVGQAVLIMALIPMGFLGAILGHIIMGLPLSFISFLGALALAGIIVNDSVVFISTYNRLVRSDGMERQKAIYASGIRRFRPILMTTLTTAIGLGPLIFQKSVGGQFLVPIAVSIAFGLIFGTFLTLILLPCVLSLMAGFQEFRSVSGSRRKDRRQMKTAIGEAAMVVPEER